ncbi:MAG TPA: YmaF family protein [Bacillales bacterium]
MVQYTHKGGHVHGNLGATTCSDGHVHMHPGVSSTPIPTQQGHVHLLRNITTYDDEHVHQYQTYTSAPIPLANGYHTHYIEVQTSMADGHTHVIKGFTEPSKE